jgi:hypothetical protein
MLHDNTLAAAGDYQIAFAQLRDIVEIETQLP